MKLPHGATSVSYIITNCLLAKHNIRSATLLAIGRNHVIATRQIEKRKRKRSAFTDVELRNIRRSTLIFVFCLTVGRPRFFRHVLYPSTLSSYQLSKGGKTRQSCLTGPLIPTRSRVAVYRRQQKNCLPMRADR